MNEAVMRAQGYAISMEHDMSRVFGCERFGFAGIINSDFIRRNPLAAILATCGFVYARGAMSINQKWMVLFFMQRWRRLWEFIKRFGSRDKPNPEMTSFMNFMLSKRIPPKEPKENRTPATHLEKRLSLLSH